MPTVKLLAALALTTSIVVAHEVGWSRATKAVTADATAREKVIQKDQEDALAQANKRVLDVEYETRETLSKQTAVYNKEIDNERKKRTRFESDVRSGAVRLSIPVSGHAHCAAAASTDTASGSASSQETRAELDPQTGIDLAAIASDGDDAIRQLNTCVDAYSAVRARYNAIENNDQTAQSARAD